MKGNVPVHPIAPFIFFAQDLARAPKAMPFDRSFLRFAFCFWRQVDGTAQIRRGDASWDLEPGDVALTEPGMGISVGMHARARRIVFALTGGPFRRAANGNYLMDGRVRPQPSWRELFDVDLVPKVADPQDVADLVDHIAGNYWRSATHRLEASARLLLWIARYVRSLQHEQPAAGYVANGDLSMEAECLIESDLRTASVSTIARKLGVTRQHLAARYRQKTGRTLGAEIHRRRIDRAQQRLRESDKAIGEVAFEVGYQSASAFTAAFRAATGTTPRIWRRQQ